MEVPLEVLDFEELSVAASLFAPSARSKSNPEISLGISEILPKDDGSRTTTLPVQPHCSNEGAPANLNSLPSDRPHHHPKSINRPLFVCESSSSSDIPIEAEASTRLDVANSTLTKLVSALGPAGPGLIAVRGMPQVDELRRKLLPLAKTLALIPHSQLRTILKDNALGTDVQLKKAERPISSFAAQVEFGNLHDSCKISTDVDGECLERGDKEPSTLGDLFRALGMRFAELGLLVARLCDVAFPDARLEQSILESGTAKGRLIHYHSPVERLSEAKGRRRSNAPMQRHSHDYSFCNKSIQPQAIKQNNSTQSETFSPHGTWQQWHYDYGILTVVTAPMFQVASVPSAGKMEDQVSGSVSQLSSSAECPPPDGHSCLQIMNLSTGLAQHAVVPHDLLIVQVGEAAQILSGGRLCATAHCVSELVSTRSVSRETFVLFLQPAWQKALVPPEGYNKSTVLGTGSWGDEESKLDKGSSPEFRSRILEFNRSVPPLASRWHESSTFAEFSKQTTRQYYGANGYQSSN